MLTGLFAAAALASATTVRMLPGEHWWGVINYYGTQMPFDEQTEVTIRDGAIEMRSAYPQKGYATVRDQFLMGEKPLARLPYFVKE